MLKILFSISTTTMFYLCESVVLTLCQQHSTIFAKTKAAVRCSLTGKRVASLKRKSPINHPILLNEEKTCEKREILFTGYFTSTF
ncbi:hypothetical protein [Lysinibacillus sp. FJAT-14222]|uniref:hypothetical protein n=1 Tax=Lysinibacillus sp. FJAT-14222 TaxID=1932366 RepID=UPI0011605323|nr:hypothetical protein [Lysinibacillus sp. FJAT-14222]